MLLHAWLCVIFSLSLSLYIYLCIYICVCVCLLLILLRDHVRFLKRWIRWFLQYEKLKIFSYYFLFDSAEQITFYHWKQVGHCYYEMFFGNYASEIKLLQPICKSHYLKVVVSFTL